jgi:hypothetical protein
VRSLGHGFILLIDLAHDLGTICREKGEMKASLRHNLNSVRWLTLVLGACGVWVGSPGCSTTSTLVPLSPAKNVELPAYAYLPHPGGYTSSDVRILFTDESAPKREALEKCDEDLRSLLSKIQSVEEQAIGVRELVSKNPAEYHWCFYSKVIELEDGLQKDEFVDEKQKRIVSAYEFLTPIARAFMQEFQDSRYMRWAIRDYRRLSDLYFYRKLELSPQMSSELVDVEVPVQDGARSHASSLESRSVLEKYKIGTAAPEASFGSSQAPPPAPVPVAVGSPPPILAPVTAPSAVPAPALEQTAENQEVEDTVSFAKELAEQRKAEASAAPQRNPASALAPVTAPSAIPSKK